MTTIYYFSATGNCMTTAREIAKYYDDVIVISISSLKDCDEIIDDSSIIGFVFPIYYSQMPYLVKEVIRKIIFTNNPYIYIFTTCRGHSGNIHIRMNQLLKEKNLSLSLARNIVMPGNSWISTKEENIERLNNQKDNIHKEIQDILDLKKEDYDLDIEIKETPVDYPNNFRGIQSDETCIGCGICEKVCPMNNIKIINKKSVIGNNCLTCLACFHWCPIESIYMSKEESVSRRFKYHHPDVTLKDIIEAKTSNR